MSVFSGDAFGGAGESLSFLSSLDNSLSRLYVNQQSNFGGLLQNNLRIDKQTEATILPNPRTRAPEFVGTVKLIKKHDLDLREMFPQVSLYSKRQIGFCTIALTMTSSTFKPYSLDRMELNRKAVRPLFNRGDSKKATGLVIHFGWLKKTNCVLALKEEIDV
ncbi:hypothetical protein JYU19_01670 [bacterium AH-315-J21]|nr:hypothetical protein [bacterium AH-315-J21]